MTADNGLAADMRYCPTREIMLILQSMMFHHTLSRGLLSTIIALGGFHMSLQADEPTMRDSVSLPQVQVVSEKPFAEVIPAQVLDARRLEQLNSLSVADALRYFSGVQIKDYGGVGGIKTIDIRSMGTNQAGIFYDGIQLGNAQNGQIDLGRFSLDNIEQISMYNGQKSDIFQSAKDYGSAGTVYLQSRRPRFESDRRHNFNVTMRTGSFGLANPSARWDWKISERVSATASAEFTSATGRYKFRYRRVFADGTVAWDTTATRRNGDITAWRAEAGVYGTMYSGYWQGKIYYYNSERGIPGAIVNNVWKNSQRQWDRSFFAQGRLQRTLSRVYAIQINAKYARDFMHYLNPDTTLIYADNRFWQDEFYVSTAHRFKIVPGWDANLSVDWQWNKLNATLPEFVKPRRNTLLAALATAAVWRRFKAQASLLGTFVFDRYSAGHGRRGRDFDRLTPAVFVSYSPWRSDMLNFRAFYKQIFRMPTFNDLYYTDVGNAALNPERATQYNAGATFHRDFMLPLRSVDVSVDAYYNEVSDKIIAVPKGNSQYRWMMMNLGRVKIQGLDANATINLMPLPGLLVGTRLSYTFQRALDYSDPSDCLDAAGTYRKQIAYIPRHSGSVTVHGAWREAELDYSFIYVGERYTNSSNIPVNYVQPWYTHDVSASYRFTFRPLTARLTLEVNNLFNQQYEVIQNFPMPGRNFRVTLKVDF